MKKLFTSSLFPPILISSIFFALYALMGIIRQAHFLSGYDLAVVDQAMWKYSHFLPPISTNHAYAFTPILWDHVELIYPLLVPFYWIANSVYTLIVLQALAISSSGVAVFLLAKKYNLNTIVSLSLVVSYLSFYGIQNAIWADVHSLVFGVSFLAWFLYFIEKKNTPLSWVFFMLTILCKEDMALLTLLMSFTLLVTKKDKAQIGFMLVSMVYLFLVFFVYFPHFVPGGYRFQSHAGLLSNIDLRNFYNTKDKQDVLLYSSIAYGFLPFLSPIYLLAALGDLAKYFILGNSVVSSGQSIFGHYRSSLAILLVWPTIVTLGKWKKLNSPLLGVYMFLCALFLQYFLHSPLSYFSKRWFYTPSSSVVTMQQIVNTIPQNASVVTQINILPHMSHRTNEFIMWPETKQFTKNSPCSNTVCNWFRWSGSPQYMIVDTSTDWDIRYWLTQRAQFVDGLKNLQTARIIKPLRTLGTTTVYAVLAHP